MMWLLLCVDNDAVASPFIVHGGADRGPLIAYAKEVHAEWLTKRRLGIRAGGKQFLLAKAEDCKLTTGLAVEVAIAKTEPLVDDMMPYIDWCTAHGLSIIGTDGAAFH